MLKVNTSRSTKSQALSLGVLPLLSLGKPKTQDHIYVNIISKLRKATLLLRSVLVTQWER